MSNAKIKSVLPVEVAKYAADIGTYAMECCGSLVNLDPDACYRVRVWHPSSDPQAEPDHAFDAVELYREYKDRADELKKRVTNELETRYRELGHLDGKPSAGHDGT